MVLFRIDFNEQVHLIEIIVRMDFYFLFINFQVFSQRSHETIKKRRVKHLLCNKIFHNDDY